MKESKAVAAVETSNLHVNHDGWESFLTNSRIVRQDFHCSGSTATANVSCTASLCDAAGPKPVRHEAHSGSEEHQVRRHAQQQGRAATDH